MSLPHHITYLFIQTNPDFIAGRAAVDGVLPRLLRHPA